MRVLPILLTAALAACGPPAETPPAPGGPSAGPSGERAVWQGINLGRERGGCPALAWSDAAAAVARAHSADMARRGYFDHASPEGTRPGQRLTSAGVAWRAIAENIALTQGGPDDAVRIWLASSPHRANIMNCTYTHTGVGEASGRWTQLFYAPR
jgi:uncharacterized protein YkwD